ncbi:MAG: cupin, partial [Gammaproteobacteria bacterium SG8_11]
MSAKDLKIVTVKSPQEITTKQKIPYFIGISKHTAGAKNISMNLVVIPPGATAQAHYHKDFETGIYVLEGEVETLYGEGLRHSVVNGPGDFIFIPPDLPHQPTNLSRDKPARAIVVRNDPNE